MIHESEYRQISEAYERMVKEARYAPAAPSDGFGNAPPGVEYDEEDLEAEQASYAQVWNAEENSATFRIGVCNGSTRIATIFAVEAARLMCGAQDERAARLLRMALRELETTPTV
jgi:hypothetical protein